MYVNGVKNYNFWTDCERKTLSLTRLDNDTESENTLSNNIHI